MRRSQILKRAFLGPSTRGEHRSFELGDSKLPRGLTKRNQPDGSRHQIAHVALQKGGQSEFHGDSLPSRTGSDHDCKRRRNLSFRE